MTKITLLKIKNSIVILLLLTVFPCQATRSEKMNLMKFWQFINNVQAKVPEGLAQVSHLFNNAFVIESENDTFISYKSKNFILDDKVNIENVEARVFRDNDKNVPYLFALQVSGACITLTELKQHYSDLTITDIPRGRSLEEETSYSTPEYNNSVKLSFGFAEKNPSCLRSVIFSIDQR